MEYGKHFRNKENYSYAKGHLIFCQGTGNFTFLNIFSRSPLNDPWASFLIDTIIAYLFPINEISNHSTACSPVHAVQLDA